MVANVNPIFTLTPKIGCALIETANTARDGTGTIGTVITGTTNGTRITRIIIKAIETTTAGMIRLFINTGAAIFLWREIPVTAITGTATVPEFTYTLELPGERALVLPDGYSLDASTEVAESFNVIAEGGDF